VTFNRNGIASFDNFTNISCVGRLHSVKDNTRGKRIIQNVRIIQREREYNTKREKIIQRERVRENDTYIVRMIQRGR